MPAFDKHLEKVLVLGHNDLGRFNRVHCAENVCARFRGRVQERADTGTRGIGYDRFRAVEMADARLSAGENVDLENELAHSGKPLFYCWVVSLNLLTVLYYRGHQKSSISRESLQFSTFGTIRT